MIQTPGIGHPTRRQLVAFAESMVDGGRPVSAALASHVTQCKQCAHEAHAIRASLEFTASAPDLKASNKLTGEILLNAKRERVVQKRSGWAQAWRMCQGVFYTTALAAMAVLTFRVALAESAPDALDTGAVVAQHAAKDTGPTPEDLRKQANEIRTLAKAMRPKAGRQPTFQERRRLRAVSAIDADITAALTALQRNPGCTRATHIVHANLERQAEALRELYVERAL